MLTIMAAVWVMLGVSLAMLGSKAGYIDAASIPGSDYAATKMPEVNILFEHVHAFVFMPKSTVICQELQDPVTLVLCVRVCACVCLPCAGRYVWPSGDQPAVGRGSVCARWRLFCFLFSRLVRHGKSFVFQRGVCC
jgi:hypothetical protein